MHLGDGQCGGCQPLGIVFEYFILKDWQIWGQEHFRGHNKKISPQK